MMAWKRANNISDLETCLEIIQDSADHYLDWTLDKINNGIDRKRGEMFYYTDGNTEIALMFQYNFTQNQWRIKHGAYRGGDGADAMAITWDKIKDFLTSKGDTEGYILIAPVNVYNQSQQPYLNYLKGLEEITIEPNDIIDKWNINL